ncbi:MAG: TetR/AcrR family transcriptional regulator [Thermodesulfobacteriota bacterium]
MADKKSVNADSNQPQMSRSAQRRQREREYRYQTILQAAETLFAREGFQKASMERLADMSEVSVGAVYFYFKNKEDLLVQMLDEIGYRLRQTLGKAFKEYGSTLEGFKQAGYSFFEEFCTHYPEKVAIIFRESVGKSAIVEAKRKEIFDKLTADVQKALLQASKNQGIEFKSKFAAEVITVSILGIYERVAYHYMFWQDMSADLKPIGRDAVSFIIGGINNLFTENGCT